MYFVNISDLKNFFFKNFPSISFLGQFLISGRLIASLSLRSRFLQTTQPRAAAPFALLIKPILKLGAALSGRSFRKWWGNLPEKQRLIYRQRFLNSRRFFTFAGGASAIFGGIFYVNHLETVPITGRRRFVAMNEELFETLLNAERQELFESISSKILPANHVLSRRTAQIVSRLLKNNEKLEGMPEMWRVIVVSDDSLVNAMCFPTGEVIVFTGLLRFVENEHQLAFVIGHEMAHVLMNHGRELIGYASIIDWLGIILIVSLWAIIPSDLLALAVQWLQGHLVHIMFQLPYNRRLEKEADEVGLSIAAAACVDIREASKFWELMDIYEVKRDGARTPEWISTHPASLERAQNLKELEGRAIELRRRCGCQELDNSSGVFGLLRSILRHNNF